ncbi:MAG: hypothetical protein DCC68_06250 [Planctomycetota bacterium]|nr:MAG: hypothetical protein DCC68_06250 [Planctomycetota bacterium]
MNREVDASENLVEEFERAWRVAVANGDPPPCVASFAARTAEDRSAQNRGLFDELLLVDLEFRWQLSSDPRADDVLGARPTWRDYGRAFPAQVAVDSLPTWMLVEEYRVRHRWGDRPSHAAFASEYPLRDLLPHLRQIDAELFADSAEAMPDLANRAATPDSSQLFGHQEFVLMSFVGQGGMGKVYRALQKSTGKIVAIKTLRKDRQTNPAAVEAFIREAELVKNLEHPHIVHVHGLGRFPAAGFFMVLDLIEGGDLQRRVSVAPLDASDAIRVALQIADALAYAHSKGILHCDLKPANILLDEAGAAFVADFGFAQLLSKNANAKSRRTVGGTLRYLAPELRDDNVAFEPTIDVFGLGAILFAMFTGNPPSMPHDVALAKPSLENAASRAVLQIVARCLNTNPAYRFQSIDEVAAALQHVAD